MKFMMRPNPNYYMPITRRGEGYITSTQEGNTLKQKSTIVRMLSVSELARILEVGGSGLKNFAFVIRFSDAIASQIIHEQWKS